MIGEIYVNAAECVCGPVFHERPELYQRGAGLTTPGPDGRPWLTPQGLAAARGSSATRA